MERRGERSRTIISANLRDFCHNSMGNSPWNLLGLRRERHPAALAVEGANMLTLINAMLRFGKGSF